MHSAHGAEMELLTSIMDMFIKKRILSLMTEFLILFPLQHQKSI